jgi:elongation factor P
MFIFNGQPYEVLDYSLNFQGRGSSTVNCKIKNLITGITLSKTLHQGDTFQEAEVTKKDLKFLYSNKGQFWFSEIEGPAKRFFLTGEQIGFGTEFLKPNQMVKGLVFQDNVVNIDLPIKVQLMVVEAPPGIKAGRAEPGTKQVTLEGGAKVNTPLFVKAGDILEINTQTGEYVKRIDE